MSLTQRHRTVALIAVALQLTAMQLSHAGYGRWIGRCERTIDGDTIVVKRDLEIAKVEVFGIDSPEIGQPFGREATYLLAVPRLDTRHRF